MSILLKKSSRKATHLLRTRISRILFSLCISTTLLFTACSPVDVDSGSSGNQIFNADIISVDIIADSSVWQNMLENASQENYIKADVVINGITYKDVGIRPKGNSSLRQVAAMAEGDQGANRYSFRIKFDEYVEGQTCLGVESIVLNNMISDNTYLKEYLSYDIMRTIGVKTPMFNFSDVKINGEAWGLYLAIEVYSDSYETRVFGQDEGMLYNVKMTMNAKGQAPAMDKNMPPDMDKNMPSGMAKNQPTDNPKNMNNTSGSLVYTDDAPSSYSAIFDNVVGSGSDEDYQRVIAAIKALNNQENLEEYFDVDAILRYLAAHTLVVNLDSYSSNMAQNYYIYENEGKLTILPWDYNMAWGGFESTNATNIVNFPIDTPVSNVTMEERPLISQLLSNEKYKERYHTYLQEILDAYFSKDAFSDKIEALAARIDPYVQNDEHAFCTYDEFKKAISTLKDLGTLRAASVQGQLEGTIPSTSDLQAKDSSLLIDASALQLSDLGAMKGPMKEGFIRR